MNSTLFLDQGPVERQSNTLFDRDDNSDEVVDLADYLDSSNSGLHFSSGGKLIPVSASPLELYKVVFHIRQWLTLNNTVRTNFHFPSDYISPVKETKQNQ